jgi:pseudouridine kinase
MIDVYCIGSAHIDNILTFLQPPRHGHTGAAISKSSIGGVGYNMALVLKNLGNSVAMSGLLGRDAGARFVLSSIAKHGIDTAAMIQDENLTTASYTAFHRPDGDMHIAAIEMDIYSRLCKELIEPHLDKLKRSKNWVFDSNYPATAFEYFATVAAENNINVYVTITSLQEGKRIIPLLPQTKALFGNVEEINYLADNEDLTETGIWRSLEIIAAKGTQAVFATHGAGGVYVLANGQRYHVAAKKVEHIVSVNGAGDTFAAAVIDSMLKNKSIEQAIEAGLIAAALRLQGKEVNALALAKVSETKSSDQSRKRMRM